MRKKIISLSLAVLLALSVLPMGLADNDEPVELAEEVTVIDYSAMTDVEFAAWVLDDANIAELSAALYDALSEAYTAMITRCEAIADDELYMAVMERIGAVLDGYIVPTEEVIEVPDAPKVEVPAEDIPEEEDIDDLTGPIDASGIVITEQPVGPNVTIGEMMTYTVKASGTGLTYQWQYSTDGSTFKSLSNGSKDTYTVKCSTKNYVYYYRCMIKDSAGKKVYSDAVQADFVEKVKITSNPVSMICGKGGTISFSVEAEGKGPLTYKWQYSKDGGTTYVSFSGTNLSAATSNFTCTATTKYNGWKFRCLVYDAGGNKAVTKGVYYYYGSPVSITAQPQNVVLPSGKAMSFSVSAEGVNLTYKWRYSKDNGNTWTAFSSTNTSATSSTLELTSASKYNGWLFRCTVTDVIGKNVISDSACYIMGTEPVIISQPQSVEVEEGETVSFRVAAAGTGLTYQWQYSINSGKTWKTTSMSGNKTDTITFAALANRDGNMYRCIVTAANGNTATSEGAQLTIVASAFEVDEVIYEALTSDTCYVKQYNGSASQLTIPETVNGYTVVEIGVSAFENNTTLQSINLPDTITKICTRAFAGCTSLSEMN